MKREYLIVGRSYWQGDIYQIDVDNITTRKEAEKQLTNMIDKDWKIHRQYNGAYDYKTGVQYKIITKTQAIKWYGKYRYDWPYHTHLYEDY